MTTSQEYQERFDGYIPRDPPLRFDPDLPRARSVDGATRAGGQPHDPSETPPPGAPGGPPPVPPQEPADRPDGPPSEAGDHPLDEPIPRAASWPLKHIPAGSLDGVPFEEQKALDDYLEQHSERFFRENVAEIADCNERAVALAKQGLRYQGACFGLMAAYGALFVNIANAVSLLQLADFEASKERTAMLDGVHAVERSLTAQRPAA